LCAFPQAARRESGYQLDKAQNGQEPTKGTRPMSNETFASVWDAIEDTTAEAENMKLRSALMMALEQHIRAKGWTQTDAARRLGVTQPRVSDLLRGKINLFALDTLVNMAAAAGLHVEMRVLEAA
jgi:predicted XRE-type DNA-binding protein